MLSTYIIWIFKINPNTMASRHSNTGKGNDLLTNNVNNTKIDWNKYGDGGISQTADHWEHCIEKSGMSQLVFFTYTQT